VLNDTWYSRDLPVLTAIAEKLERGSTPVDTEQLIDELGLTRQDLMAALRALDVEYLIVRWPERITFRRSGPSTVVEAITSRAREAVGLWPSAEARQTAQPRPGHDQIKRPRTGAIRDVQRRSGFHGPTPPRRSSVILVTYPGGGSGIPGKMTSGPR